MSTFQVIDQSLTRTTCSTSDLLFVLSSVIYKVINQIYYERNLFHTSMNQNVEEAHMTATTSQLDAVTTFHTSKHKILMKDSHSMREKQINQPVSLKSTLVTIIERVLK